MSSTHERTKNRKDRPFWSSGLKNSKLIDIGTGLGLRAHATLSLDELQSDIHGKLMFGYVHMFNCELKSMGLSM